MDILNDKILLAITEQEADVLQHALSVWRGPYTDEQRLTLTEGERQSASWRLKIGKELCEKLQQELIDRYEIEETRKVANVELSGRPLLACPA